MPERTYHAVILKRKDTGESDRRLTVLTQEAGLLDVTARGAKKSGSRLAGVSEPLSACILHLAEGRHNAFVTQAQPVSSFRGLRADYNRLSLALALAELAANVLPHEQPAPEAFVLFVTSLKYLESHPKPIVVLVWAELRLLELTGFMPNFEECVVKGTPVQEAVPFLSPHAGGYISNDAANAFTDRFQTRAEVLYGLVALQKLEAPATNLKLADEALIALYPFWRAIADRPLPANEEVIRELRGL